jgi:hypothetical protein
MSVSTGNINTVSETDELVLFSSAPCLRTMRSKMKTLLKADDNIVSGLFLTMRPHGIMKLDRQPKEPRVDQRSQITASVEAKRLNGISV